MHGTMYSARSGTITPSECCTHFLIHLLLNSILKWSDLCSRDKRPYEFIHKDPHGNMSVKRCIPDATMGLRTYSESDFDHGYTCAVVDCKINHDNMQPNETLLDHRIKDQMYDQQCGLIVDGIWGESNLIFPFAVYEAKNVHQLGNKLRISFTMHFGST
jgi:hypothetical protein